jgi:hypothetical protein
MGNQVADCITIGFSSIDLIMLCDKMGLMDIVYLLPVLPVLRGSVEI